MNQAAKPEEQSQFQPVYQGRIFMVRYADDFVMGFERLEVVHKVQWVIAKRFARLGLKINTEKTRLVRFGRPSSAFSSPEPKQGLGARPKPLPPETPA